MNNKLAFLILLATLLTSAYTCKSPNSPDDGGNADSDTTSHNFTWQIDTIGYRNTNLMDGVIINENDMWVVGEIYPDSASYKDAVAYGAAHWDGVKWTAQKIQVKSLAGNIIYLRPSAIIQKGEKEFWLGMAHVFDGEKITKSYWIHNFFGNPNPIFDEGQNPIHFFKSADNQFYVYGYHGALGYFNGTEWIKIPTNTTLDIMDMHGDYNPYTKEYELLALASRPSQMEGNLLMKIKNNSVSELSVKGINDYSKDNLWFYQGSNYWIVGDGVYFKKTLADTNWQRKNDHPSSNWIAGDINGWQPNDLLMTLADGHLLHYNGSTWKDFKQELNLPGIEVNKIVIKNDVALIMGGEFNQTSRGILIRGKRKR